MTLHEDYLDAVDRIAFSVHRVAITNYVRWLEQELRVAHRDLKHDTALLEEAARQLREAREEIRRLTPPPFTVAGEVRT